MRTDLTIKRYILSNSTMKHIIYLLLIKLLIISVVPIIESANILAIFPSVWRSHYIFGTAILQKLSTNGHNITLITGLNQAELHPIQNSHAFTKQISIPLLNQNWIDSGLCFDFECIKKISPLEYFTRMVYASTSNIDIILMNKNVKELISNPDNKFDLVIGDVFPGDAFLGFTHRFSCPMVVVSPTGNNKWIDEMTGNPNTASRNPSSFLSLSEEMDLLERIQNALMNIFEKFSYNFFHIVYQEKLYQRYFKQKSKTLPPLRSLIENIDLVLLNSNPLTEYPNAFLPHIIEVGGAHILHNQGSEVNVPQAVVKFIEDSISDVIYINFGTNVNISDMMEEKLNELIILMQMLEAMNMRIILKWERVEPPFVSKNLFTKYWLPQQEILAHPKVKIFITTGGHMSIMEAIFYEKLILGIPLLPQHEVHLKRLQNQGYGVMVETYEHLNSTNMLNKTKALMNNETHCEQNKKISQQFKNVPNNPMNLSTYYIELLIKEKRLNYLKPSYNKMNFVQRELIDVILIIILGVLVIVGLPSIVICFILRKTNVNSTIDNNLSRSNSSKRFSSYNVDISASALLKKLMRSKSIDVKNKNKYKRN